MSLGTYLDHFLSAIHLDHPVRDGIRYHRCQTCHQEWRAENPGDAVNPAWWRCSNGCNAEAGRVQAPRVRVPRQGSRGRGW
jgi:hypothetical protein